MLIDYTYFYGPLMVAQIGTAAVQSNLQQYINRYEPRIMDLLLGYELYRDFKAGLIEDPVLQKWTDLLYGKEYTDRKNNVRRWMGFVAYTDGITVNGYTPSDIDFIVDTTPGIASGQNQYRNNFLTGKTFRVIERVTGKLLDGIDITIVSNGFDLTGRNFNAGAVYTIQFTQPVPLPTPGQIIAGMDKKSLIANFVYFNYLNDNVTQTTGTGEKVVQSENAIDVTSRYKTTDAWNEMVDYNKECREFLLSNADVYTQYQDPCAWRLVTMKGQERRNVLETINAFNW